MNGTEARFVERIVKGFANHRRLQILELLRQEPDMLLDQIAERLDISYMNTSDHLRRMVLGGLVAKRHEGVYVHHRLTDRGKEVLVFCKKL